MNKQWISRALTLALTLAISAAPAAAGLYLEQSVTSSGQGQGMTMNVRAWAEGDSVKVEYTSSDSPVMPEDSYLLTNDGGETVYLVRPADGTYSKFDMNQLLATVGQLSEATGGMVKIDFKDPKTESLDSGDGGEILGYDTTRRSWRTTYGMDMKVAFIDQSNRIDTVTEAWITDKIDYPALGIWFTAKPRTTGDPEFDEIITSGMDQIDGLVLKMKQDTTTTNKKGKESKSSMLMEVTALREESIDGKIFEMPDGLTEAPLVPGLSGDGDESDGPMKNLKGLFGRKKKN